MTTAEGKAEKRYHPVTEWEAARRSRDKYKQLHFRESDRVPRHNLIHPEKFRAQPLPTVEICIQVSIHPGNLLVDDFQPLSPRFLPTLGSVVRRAAQVPRPQLFPVYFFAFPSARSFSFLFSSSLYLSLYIEVTNIVQIEVLILHQPCEFRRT